MRSRIGWLLAFVAGLALVGCGGGGGGGGGLTDYSTAPGLTLSASSASFTTMEGMPPSAAQNINVTVTSNEVQKVVVGYPPGVPVPGWLQVQLAGSLASSVLTISAGGAGVAPGTYRVTLRVAVGRADDSLIAYRDIQVTLRVDAALVPGVGSLSQNGVSGASPGSTMLSINAPGLTWTATSTAPWMQLSAVAGTGSGTLTVNFLPAGLAPGSYSTEIVLSGSNGVVQRITVTFTVAAPALTVGTGAVVIGGPNGRDPVAQTVPMSLNTGANAYTWTVSGVPTWLNLSASGGVIDGAGQMLTFTPVVANAPLGISNITLRFTASINGVDRSTDVAVTLNRDEHRLIGETNGVAFVSTPSVTRLTRALTLRSSFDTAVNWTASSNVPWLAVTPNGTTGGTLTLVANPAGLAVDQVHMATVNVAAGPDVVAERIRVGLWVGAADPVGRLSVANGMDASAQLVADPVRPYVYLQTNIAGANLVVYNIYTGAEVQRISFPARIGIMTIASDGDTLYLNEEGNGRIRPIDLNTFQLAPFWNAPGPTNQRDTMLYTRVRGVPVVVSPWGAFLADGTRLTVTSGGPILPLANSRAAATPDGKALYVYGGGSAPAWVEKYDLDRSALAPTTLVLNKVREIFSQQWGGGVGEDIAVSSDNNTVYASSNIGIDAQLTALELAYLGSVFQPSALRTIQVECASDGSIFYAVANATNGEDIVSLSPSAVVTPRAASGTLGASRMVVSGDGRMVIVIGFMAPPLDRNELIFLRASP